VQPRWLTGEERKPMNNTNLLELNRLFECGHSEADFDAILSMAEHRSPAFYREALRLCNGRDSRSKRLEASRQRAAEFLSSF
jgi:hypothetical protein